MKRITTLFVALTFLLTVFAACSDTADSGEGKTGGNHDVLTDAKESPEAKSEESGEEAMKIELKIITQEEMPETRDTENMEGKGLEEYDTAEKTPEVFFESESPIRSAVLAADDKLFFGNENCDFFAVDINTRQLLWEYKIDYPIQTNPVYSEGKIIFNAVNTLYILDAGTGNELHKVTHPREFYGRASEDRYAFHDSYTAVNDNTAYFTAADGSLFAVDINTGDIIWSLEAVTPGPVSSGVNIWDGKLFYVDVTGTLCGVDTEARQMYFQTQIEDKIYAPMHIDSGKIHVAGRSGKMYCVDADTGSVLWSSYSANTTTWFSGGSVTIGDMLYTGTSDERMLNVYDKNTGELLRHYPTDSNVYVSPVKNGDNVIVVSVNVYSFNESYVMEFDTANHIKLWRAALNDGLLSSPVIYKSVLYFGSDSGTVYNIQLS